MLPVEQGVRLSVGEYAKASDTTSDPLYILCQHKTKAAGLVLRTVRRVGIGEREVT